MKTRTILLASLFVLALLVSACGPTTINQEAPPPQRTLSVSGTGTANLTPDIAYVTVGVHTEKLTAAEAVAENNAQTEKVNQSLIDFGIEAKDIRTTSFSIWPMDKYDPSTGMPAHTGVAAVTVVAGEAWWAQALAKAAFVGGAEAGIVLLARHGVTGLVVRDTREKKYRYRRNREAGHRGRQGARHPGRRTFRAVRQIPRVCG